MLVRWAYPNDTRSCPKRRSEPLDRQSARIRPCRASPSHLASTARNHPCGSFSRATDLQFRLPPPKLAVQERYNQKMRLSVSSCSLQGITERPLPCDYNVIQFVCAFTAVTRVQIPSGTPNLINNLRERRQFCAGTKRNIGNNYPTKMPCNIHVCKGLQVLVRGYKRHNSSIRLTRSVFPV